MLISGLKGVIVAWGTIGAMGCWLYFHNVRFVLAAAFHGVHVYQEKMALSSNNQPTIKTSTLSSLIEYSEMFNVLRVKSICWTWLNFNEWKWSKRLIDRLFMNIPTRSRAAIPRELLGPLVLFQNGRWFRKRQNNNLINSSDVCALAFQQLMVIFSLNKQASFFRRPFPDKVRRLVF